MTLSRARRELLLRLNAAGGDPDAVRRMLKRAPPDGLLEASPEELAAWGETTPEASQALLERARSFDAARELEEAASRGVKIVDCESPRYPALLKVVPQAPLLLYVLGSLGPPEEAGPAVAIVGARRPSAYGLRMARRLAGEAAAAGGLVVSGLARGIDTAAHEAALEGGAPTWAVLGSGLGRLYPPENETLARRIASSGGCLISEYPLSTPALPGHFPRRNRIVSGLSWATVVVEGAARSGSLITARLALDQGRSVFAVPGPADSPLSAAPHALIRLGAALATSIQDVWEELPPGVRPIRPAARRPSQARSLSLDQRKILQSLGPDALSLDELEAATGIDMPRLSTILFSMELEDLIGPVPGQRYAKKGI